MRFSRCNRRFGISALQLVVVLAVLLLGMALLLPIIQRLRQASAQTLSTNNLRQLALAMHNYHAVNNVFPPAVGEQGNQQGSAHFHILPYIEQQPLYQKGEGASWKNGVYGNVIAVFLDSRDTSSPTHVYKNWLATTNYPINWLIARDGKMKIIAITDGTSNTLMFATRYQMCNGEPAAWGYPSIYRWAPMFAYYTEAKFQSAPPQHQCDPTRAQSIGGGMLVALCDGSVRSVSDQMSALTWVYLCDPNDGNPLPNDF